MSKPLTKKQKAMIEALEETYHNITKACKMIGISTQTHYDWLAKFDDYKRADRETREGHVHRAEEILHSKFETDTTALIFFLKCKGDYNDKPEEIKQDINTNVTIAFE